MLHKIEEIIGLELWSVKGIFLLIILFFLLSNFWYMYEGMTKCEDACDKLGYFESTYTPSGRYSRDSCSCLTEANTKQAYGFRNSVKIY